MSEHTHEHEHEHAHDHEHEHDHGHDHEHEHNHEHDHEHDEHDEEHELEHYRMAVDEFMRNHPQSPLGHEQQHGFPGLSYYPFNPAMHMHLPLDTDVSDEPVTMQTSTGDNRIYHRAGKIHFEVDNQPAELTIYQDEEGDLFLPMRDATSGNETYGAGRYLEPGLVDDKTVHVDFNYLYNPYCAYNEAYSCPLPPMENWIRVPIQAGEKTVAKEPAL
jgi:uncharacterized protein (DUF1684 family)